MKKRKDCFFGLHFDYHAEKNEKNVGKDLKIRILEKLLDEVKPDFVQCDSKGHPGIASFVTKVGTSVKFYKDSMSEWRRISAKYGVLLYAHYSGLFDVEAMKSHPEWAYVDKEGKVSEEYASVFGEYADKLMIPQLKELAGEYGLNGAWVDGECWGAFADYSEKTKNIFKERTGLNADKETKLFIEFCRQGFRDYVAHYVKEVKKDYPDFEIASNWMCSSIMPEKPTVPVDFLSGDLAPIDSVNSARKEARLLENMGKPWDLMAWGFSFPIYYVKGVAQLQQEAAAVISHGGGFQVYERQDLRYGISDECVITDLVEISKFCNARKKHVWKCVSDNDTCVVYSTKAYYDMNGERLFGALCKYNDDLNGVLNNILDNGFATDVLLSADVTYKRLKEYGLVILSNATILENELKLNLLDYVKSGGNLVVSGVDTLQSFSDDLGIVVSEMVKDSGMVQLCIGDKRVYVQTSYSTINGNGVVLEEMTKGESGNDILTENSQPVFHFEKRIPAAMKFAYGNGTVTVIPFNIGAAYNTDKTYQLQEFFDKVLSVYDRKVKCDKKHIEVNLTEKNGVKYIHLINLLGDHESIKVKTFDSIPPIYDITVNVKTNEKVSSLVLIPENKPLKFFYTDVGIRFTVNKLDIYSLVEIK